MATTGPNVSGESQFHVVGDPFQQGRLEEQWPEVGPGPSLR